MQKNSSQGGQRVFLWLTALTLIVIAGAVIYSVTRQGSGGAVTSVRADDYVRGDAGAQAVLIEYSDFQCPACGAFYLVVKDLEAQLGTSTAVVYRHFPLSQHQNAEAAAQAAEAAGLQGKFWEMHDQLFETQTDWSDLSSSAAHDYFVKLAEKLDLETERFSNDMKSPDIASRISRDQREGTAVGVNATPTFYLNGKKLILRNFNDLMTEVQAVIHATDTR